MNRQNNFLSKGLSLFLICALFLVFISFDSMGVSAQAALQTSEYEVIILTAPAPLTHSDARGVGAGQVAGTGRIPGSTYPSETHALVWNLGSSVGVDLHPADFRYSAAFDTNGQQQVGSGSGQPTYFREHALLWNGSASNFIDLHPTNGKWTDSVARGIAGNQQVGNINYYFYTSYERIIIEHAALWSGSAASVVDLHPPLSNCERSYASDTDGSRQVGHCYFSATDNTPPYQALLWSGTAASAVSLHPPGFTHSFAEGVSGDEQVGYAFSWPQGEGDGYSRAFLWHGIAASAVSLHPAGYLATTANATNGIHQVGSGGTPDNPQVSHALRWSGTANSVVDLHLLLPSEFNSSIAYDIDSAGNIVGLAQRPDGSTVGVLWRRTSGSPIPTPTPTVVITPIPTTATPAASPDFTLNVSPASQTVRRQNSTAYNITINALNGFTGAVQLSVSGAPKRSNAGFSLNPINLSPNGTGSSVLDIRPQANAPTGTFTLTIQATGGGRTHSQTVTLIISP